MGSYSTETAARVQVGESNGHLRYSCSPRPCGSGHNPTLEAEASRWNYSEYFWSTGVIWVERVTSDTNDKNILQRFHFIYLVLK